MLRQSIPNFFVTHTFLIFQYVVFFKQQSGGIFLFCAVCYPFKLIITQFKSEVRLWLVPSSHQFPASPITACVVLPPSAAHEQLSEGPLTAHESWARVLWLVLILFVSSLLFCCPLPTNNCWDVSVSLELVLVLLLTLPVISVWYFLSVCYLSLGLELHKIYFSPLEVRL